MDPRVMTILLDEPHMPRFDKVDPTGELEAPFETVALRMLSRLYPSCHVFVFKPNVTHNGVGWRPDIAIVDCNWTHWFVVEVEILTHSLEKHVLPQVRAFRDGEYGPDTVASIAEACDVSPDHAATFLRYIPRYVTVVSNHENEEWARQLAEENIQYISIASYERVSGPPAYVVTGLLRAAERSLGFGTALSSQQAVRLPRTDFWEQKSYRVAEPGGTANWDCTLDDKVVWLTKRRGFITIQDKAWVQMIVQDDGLLLLRPI